MFKPGDVVAGPFFSAEAARPRGVGIVRAQGDVDSRYVHVKVVTGDRISGGYRPEGLRLLTDLRPA